MSLFKFKSYFYNKYKIDDFNISNFQEYIYQSTYLKTTQEIEDIKQKLCKSEIYKIFHVKQINNFINLSLKYEKIEEICKLYTNKPIEKEKIIIDFIGTNFGKKMHFGHLRSIIIGKILINLLKYYGLKVSSDAHFGDYGINLAIFIKYNRKYKDLNTLTIDQISNIYKENMEIIKTNNNEHEYTKELILLEQNDKIAKETYKILQEHNKKYLLQILNIFIIKLNYWYGEFRYINNIKKLIKKYIKEKYIFTDEYNRLVTINKIVLTRNDQTPIYAFTDIATVLERIQNKYEKIIYIVDKRQAFHFQLIKEFINEKLKHKIKIIHIGFGFIQDNENTILKSRGTNYTCIIKIINTKLKKYNTNIPNIMLAIILYEMRHDIFTDYVLMDSIIDLNIIAIIKFNQKIKDIQNTKKCCKFTNKCICLSQDEKIIIKNICLLYEYSIKSINKLNIHLMYKILQLIITDINKYKKLKPSIVFYIAIKKLLNKLLNSIFNYNLINNKYVTNECTSTN